MIKALKKLEMESSYISIVKAIWHTYSPHYIEWEKMKAFHLKSRPRQGCPFSLLLFNRDRYKIIIQNSLAFVYT
jgi:hypothetical protein